MWFLFFIWIIKIWRFTAIRFHFIIICFLRLNEVFFSIKHFLRFELVSIWIWYNRWCNSSLVLWKICWSSLSFLKYMLILRYPVFKLQFIIVKVSCLVITVLNISGSCKLMLHLHQLHALQLTVTIILITIQQFLLMSLLWNQVFWVRQAANVLNCGLTFDVAVTCLVCLTLRQNFLGECVLVFTRLTHFIMKLLGNKIL